MSRGMSPEQGRFIALLRLRQLELQKDKLRLFAHRHPGRFAEIARSAVEGPRFWPLIARALGRRAPSGASEP